MNETIDVVFRLDRIQRTLDTLLIRQTIKDWYTTDEAAEILGKAAFTVREWCRNKRCHASKRATGRGRAKEWVISHAELERLKNEGLLGN